VILFHPQNVGIDKGDIPDLTKVIIIELLLTKEKLEMFLNLYQL
jgi:hypothetical protein